VGLDLGDCPLQHEDLPDPATFEKFHPFIKGVFSQWHFTPFMLDGQQFVTGEQAMMFAKAELFDDTETALQIMATSDPAGRKRLGRLVRGFDGAIWDRWKLEVVYRINRAKFGQNSGAARQLLATGGAMLVEANFSDWIWGVGLSMEDPRVHDPKSWNGTNYLGRILTLIRSELEQERAGS
jgi:ribA/ribD-fused uncharacterized protein